MSSSPKTTNDQRAGWMNEPVSLGRKGMSEEAGGPFGAVVVCEGKVVGRGHNQVTTLLDPTAHAEVMAIPPGLPVADFLPGVLDRPRSHL